MSRWQAKKRLKNRENLNNRYEYTVAILDVYLKDLSLLGAITATVNSQDVRNRADFLEMDEKEDYNYNRAVIREI